MHLPNELLDEIFSNLPSDNERSLRNCSLVSKSWLDPSRRRLFESVYLKTTKLRFWRDSVPASNDGLLQHVRTLTYIADNRCVRTGFPPEYHVTVLRDYFPRLHQLQHLFLGSVYLPSTISRKIKIFSAFRHTLSQLTLGSCNVAISALITIINYFPNLDRLDLHRLYEVDGEPAPPLTHPLLGQLRVARLREGRLGLGLVDQLSELGLAFGEIVFTERIFVHARTLERVVNSVGTSIKRLRLLSSLENYRVGDRPTMLSHCRELRELEIPVSDPGTEVVNLLSSITSTSIQKVTFVVSSTLRRIADWRNLNDPLCRLADQSGYKYEVEVDFQFVDAEAMEVDKVTGQLKIVRSLAKFRKKGQMKVIQVDSGGSRSIIYSSNGVM